MAIMLDQFPMGFDFIIGEFFGVAITIFYFVKGILLVVLNDFTVMVFFVNFFADDGSNRVSDVEISSRW